MRKLVQSHCVTTLDLRELWVQERFEKQECHIIWKYGSTAVGAKKLYEVF